MGLSSEYDYSGTVVDGIVLGNPYYSDGLYRWDVPVLGFINEFGQIETVSVW
jgi:hypothetical protein